MEYDEQDFLMISGIQHYQFCPRQWALDHIEHQWRENYLTTEGHAIHEHVHDAAVKEKRGNLLITRGMPVQSRQFGIYGVCDAVEFHRDKEAGVAIFGYSGSWLPCPVEYKHGHLKTDQSDQMQLLPEAVCLEEMLVCQIDYGYLYFNETHARVKVEFDPALRQQFSEICTAMHQLWQRQYTPKVRPSKKCQRCSLQELCLPQLTEKETVSTYLKRRLSS